MASEQSNQPSRLEIIDVFVIVSVGTIIVIRSFLILTGFPRIGGESFHIAHMLWGGLALTAALLISLLQRQANRELLAALGGVGFGFFIDEIGKFVTSDNNYFYDGSFFLMYVTILGLWLIARGIVVRSEKQAFFLPAIWPTRRVEQFLICLWALCQIVYLPMLAYNIRRDSIFDFIALVGLLCYFFALLLGLSYVIRRRTAQAATTFRLATFLAIIVIMPFDYFRSPLYAFMSTLVSVLVMIGLSEVSIKQLVRQIISLRLR